LKASNAGGGDEFGVAVAISGDTLVVGARYESSSATGIGGNQANDLAPDSGAAYVFVRSGTQWTQQAYLKASNTGLSDLFGAAVAIDRDTVVVGAKGEASNATGVDGNQKDNSLVRAGAAYVFARAGTNWSQEAYLKSIRPGRDHAFGRSVAISGDTVVVGAYGESGASSGVNGDPSNQTSSETGAAYVFTRTNRVWTHQAYVKASNPAPFGWFGYSVALSGDTLVVGAIGDSSNAKGVNGNQTNTLASDSGAAYVFTRTGNTWAQQAYLKASNTGEEDAFGSSVTVWGDTVVVGADDESSSGRGINSTVVNRAAELAGAAYVFTRSGTAWKQQAYLKSSNTRTFYRFGNSVAFEAGTALVGSFGEGSNATGVNGNQSNTAADGAGAAYVFTGLGPVVPAPGALLSVGASGGVGVARERQLTVQGVPGQTYHLQAAAAVVGPWKDVAGSGASGPADGTWKRVLVDTAASDETTFYRVVEP